MKPIKNDGGPAFPSKMLVNRFATEETAQKLIGADGMTLRDWFAGMALMGFSTQPDNCSTPCDNIAGWSYQQADAMLATRELKEEA
tara:strand:- start:2118 stop:2375 length:258 start_codon:yes stop_codon:yes gene_type:complete